jgi:hypothetical protein
MEGEPEVSDDLEAQMAAEAARATAERLAREAAAAKALEDAKAALEQSGVSIPPGAWGH